MCVNIDSMESKNKTIKIKKAPAQVQFQLDL